MSNPSKKSKGKQMYIVTKKAFYCKNCDEVRTRTVHESVSLEFYRAYNKETGRYRLKQRKRLQCKCPKDKWWQCDTDCALCKYYRAGKQLSLDGTYTDKIGDTYSMDQYLGLESADFEEGVADTEMFSEMLTEMAEIFPEIKMVASLLVAGYTETEIAEKIGIPRTTLRSRLQKIKRLFYERYRAYKDGDDK